MQVWCSEIDRPRFDTQTESMSFPDHDLRREITIVFKHNKRRDEACPTRGEDIRIDSLRSLSHLLTKGWTGETVKA